MLSAASFPDPFAKLRAEEFSRLDRSGLVYLDYTGSALYAESQLAAHHALLSNALFGNPHSEHAASRASTKIVRDVRDEVLRFFDVDASTHEVVFTANTTAAIKLVAESFSFDACTPLVLSADNHNSMNGIREYARRAGAPVRSLPLDDELRLLEPEPALARVDRGLLGFPAQSNFSGVRHPLSLVAHARSLGYRVLLDVAAYVAGHALSLRTCAADFVALSFYKMFGYPTGIGALVARRDALAELRRPWFAGGTVRYASVQADTYRIEAGHAGFEDGTPDFLGIAALSAGFALLERVEMSQLTAHVARLTARFLDGLSSLPVRIHGPNSMSDRGGTVAFNVRAFPYWVVEQRARASGIALRGGCFCNPGASEIALRLPAARTAGCLAILGDDFSVERFATCLDSPVGALRASFGLANNDDDVRRALAFVAGL
jgi:selenocysteine lyase/cysteine desulfurase